MHVIHQIILGYQLPSGDTVSQTVWSDGAITYCLGRSLEDLPLCPRVDISQAEMRARLKSTTPPEQQVASE